MTIDLQLINFPGAPNLPIFVGQELGFFETAGVRANLNTTPSSVYQIEHLMKGKYQIAGTAIDNVVAYTENQGAITLSEKSDIFAFMGATQLELSFVVSPEIQSFADLKGKTIALDALSTGFAFILYRMLENAGVDLNDITMVAVGATPERWESVKTGEHIGTLTIEPFTAMAKAAGFKILESSLQTVKAYQGGSFAARKNWAKGNRETLRGFITGYLDSLEWTLDSENRQTATEILLRNMPNINAKAIDKVMDKLLSPDTGLTPFARIDKNGFNTVLELRSRYGGRQLSDPSKYLDLTYYQQAIGHRLAS
ncbi:MAG: ABC transporter substrate-binding protein [Alphaproteobacteria bacterium]|jgi:ABC-type nitrate/sulfonate/bicarbonate transport system substrate-binding protein